jgi:primosomal protein N' (replication factor Y)
VAAKHRKDRREQLWLLAAEGQNRQGLIAEVADVLAGQVRPGVLLRVPYGRSGQTREGWCVRVTRGTWDQTHKPIDGVVIGTALLNEPLLELGLWVSEYYACPPGQTFDAIVPSVLRKPRLQKGRYVRATGRAPEGPLSKQQRALLEAIGDKDVRRDTVLRTTGAGASSLQTLRKRGLLEILSRREPVLPVPFDDSARAVPTPESDEDHFALTSGQQAAVETLERATSKPGVFKVFLLFGVPGSGKTEVYVRALRQVIATGRQAIMLVPEIALATQVVERLARRFGRVAVMHSRLKASVRARTLRAIAAGAIDLVIGTRTAVFAPSPRLGLIVVDEEQESSFKSLAAPFCHARDVAIKRGQIEKIPVILGSATPALETWTNANNLSHFELLRLPERVPGARLPTVKLVEMRRRGPSQASDVLSTTLIARLRETLAAQRQAILLHNRRGYAVYLRCEACGLPVTCERCGAHMVYHRAESRMKCHRCGAWSGVPPHCLDDSCAGRLRRAGVGIQRLEQELGRMLPEARLQRLDSDTMRRREDYAAALSRFAEGNADILLGTQMVAKGLDFPRVALVGVLEADAALWLPDFRAAESAFQLLVQVVGRAGRREGDSLALVQVENPTLPAIHSAVALDYAAFAETELGVRQRLFDPPFSRLIRFICADPKPSKAEAEAYALADRLRTLAGRVHAGIRVDQAEVCVIARLRERTRYHVIVRAPRDVDLRPLLRLAEQEKALAPRVKRFTVDVDPIEML